MAIATLGKSKKVVSKLIEDIGTLRDLLEEKNYDKIDSYRSLLERVLSGVKTQYQKYLRDPNHTMDFNSYDLEELSDDIKSLLSDVNRKINFKYMKTQMLKNGEEKFGKLYCTYYRVRSVLIELHSALMYVCVCYRMLEEGSAKRVPAYTK